MLERLYIDLKMTVIKQKKILFFVLILNLLPLVVFLMFDERSFGLKTNVIWSGVINFILISLFFAVVFRLPVVSNIKLTKLVSKAFVAMAIFGFLSYYYIFWKLLLTDPNAEMTKDLYLLAIMYCSGLFLGNYISISDKSVDKTSK